MATDIIARAIGQSAKDKTDKITVNNNINLDIVSSTLAEINYSTIDRGKCLHNRLCKSIC